MAEPNPLAQQAETTFCLFKPQMVTTNLFQEVIQYLQRNKFTVLSTRNLYLTKDVVREMLQPFFAVMPEKVMESMVGPAISVELTREGAIASLKHVTGHDDPRQAKMGTIRYMWGGFDTAHNCVFIPQNEAEFKHMFGVIDLWSRVLIHALNERIEGPIAWGEERWQKMMVPDEVTIASQSEVIGTGNEFELPSEKSVTERVAEGYDGDPSPMGGA